MTMKKLVILAFSLAALAAPLRAAEPAGDEQQFLQHYVKVQAALAADDLAGAKQAAGELGAEGKPLAESEKIADARNAFEKLSEKAIPLAKGKPEYTWSIARW